MKRTNTMQSTCLAKKDFQKIGASFDYTKYYLSRRNRVNQVRKQQINNLNNVDPNNNKRHSLDSFMNNKNKSKWLRPLRRRSAPVPVIPDKNLESSIPVILLLYNHLQMLFVTAKEYAIIHKCLCNSIKTGSFVITEEQTMENRKRLSFVLDEIAHISRRIENLNLEKEENQKQTLSSIQHLKRNIRLHANIFIEDISLRVSEEAESLLDKSFKAVGDSPNQTLSVYPLPKTSTRLFSKRMRSRSYFLQTLIANWRLLTAMRRLILCNKF